MKRKTIPLTLLIFAFLLGACGPASDSDQAMIAVVENFQTANKAGDWEKAASYLAENVVWETPTGNVTGRDNWLAAVVKDNGGGIFEDVQNRYVKDNKVIVEMIVTGPDFQSPATAEVVVEDGKIQRYTVIPPD